MDAHIATSADANYCYVSAISHFSWAIPQDKVINNQEDFEVPQQGRVYSKGRRGCRTLPGTPRDAPCARKTPTSAFRHSQPSSTSESEGAYSITQLQLIYGVLLRLFREEDDLDKRRHPFDLVHAKRQLLAPSFRHCDISFKDSTYCMSAQPRESVVTGVVIMRQAPLTGGNDARSYFMPAALNDGCAYGKQSPI